MTTQLGEELVVLNDKQSLGLVELKDNLFDRLLTGFSTLIAAVWPGDAWHLDNPTLSASPGEFTVEAGKTGSTGASEYGGLIETGTPYAYDEDVAFENTPATWYYIGFKAVRVPTTIKGSRSAGVPQYTAERVVAGYKDTPDSVADDGDGTMTVIVDSVCEAAHDQSGRTAVIYLVDPVSTNEAVAIEECTVQWDGANNYIETTGDLGQGTISTTAADYVVVLLGPMVRYSSLHSTDGVLFVGGIQGSGGTDTSTNVTVVTSFTDLNKIISYGADDLPYLNVVDAAAAAGTEKLAFTNATGAIWYVDDGGGVTKKKSDDLSKTLVSYGDNGFTLRNQAGTKILEVDFGAAHHFKLFDDGGNEIADFDGLNDTFELKTASGSTIIKANISDGRVVFGNEDTVTRVDASADTLSDSVTSEQDFAQELTFDAIVAGPYALEVVAFFTVTNALGAGRTCDIRVRMGDNQLIGQAQFDESDVVADTVLKLTCQLMVANDTQGMAHWDWVKDGVTGSDHAYGFSGIYGNDTINFTAEFSNTGAGDEVRLLGAYCRAIESI